MTQEVWKPIVGYEGRYEVSDLGRVRSLPGNHVNGRIIRQAWRGRFLSVDLSMNGYRKSFSVSRLVAEAFLPNPKKKTQVNHINPDRSKNHASNLEWVTPKENTAHAIAYGLRKPIQGEKAGQAKLTEKQAIEIIYRRRDGEKVRDIAKDYPVSHQTISDICTLKKWKHLLIHHSHSRNAA